MNSKQIRATFLEFFKNKQHHIVPSAPMVVKGDPTLMFNNSGMAPFKDLFLGNAPIKHPRIADTQKCLRVSGKHNDLEEVGVDTYHHTMFEMLGNWSFGDYFKKEAITWAWELLTDVYKIDTSRLYVTVFEGSEPARPKSDLSDAGGDDKLSFDQEAYDIWKQFISEDRILKGNKKDNFWEMGDVGPCGPCSEIHYDGRSDEERQKVSGAELVNADHPQVIEIWNNVFMEFERRADGSLVKLPKQHVDTGMGFERLVRVLQGKQSNYDTDVFMPYIHKIEEISGVKYGTSEATDIATRVISDHIRAIAFSIADGQLPSNTGAGYVIRRILRRAIRYAYQNLNLKEPFMGHLVDVMEAQMGEAFPELKSQKELIKKVVEEEEISFYRTLENGLKRMDAIIKSNVKTIEGKAAFELYDTFGFPLDLISLIARENKLQVDIKGFDEELQKQKDRSRSASAIETGDWEIVRTNETCEFLGYDLLECDVQLVKYRKVKQKQEEFFQLVFDKTPFYPEGGGQVGDTGVLENGNERIDIIDTKKENNLIVHFSKSLPKDVKATFKAKVEHQKRMLTVNNHSATHLLHEALREVLGTHVEQKGSLVNDQYLRFDFSHFSKVTEEELSAVEQKVNQNIRASIMLNEHRQMAIEDAKKMGAMALFGEKYGDTVRVIQFGASVELCGGIHVQNTSTIGNFKIVSEGSVASGVRRVEAITSIKADEFLNTQIEQLEQIKALLKHPKDVIKTIEDLVEQNATLSKQLEAFQREKAMGLSSELVSDAKEVNGIKFIAKKVDLDNGSIKDLAFKLKAEHDNLFMVLANEESGKATLSVAVSDKLIASHKLHAGNIVKALAKEIDGGGGGQPSFATAGGKSPQGIAKALELASSFIA
jgi:alanyl-tRNA synthetase